MELNVPPEYECQECGHSYQTWDNFPVCPVCRHEKSTLVAEASYESDEERWARLAAWREQARRERDELNRTPLWQRRY